MKHSLIPSDTFGLSLVRQIVAIAKTPPLTGVAAQAEIMPLNHFNEVNVTILIFGTLGGARKEVRTSPSLHFQIH